MAATLDANATADVTASGVTTVSLTTLTVGSGTNRALVGQVAFNNKAITAPSAAWDPTGTNQALTQIVTANGTGTDGRAELWGLVAPTTGNLTLKFSWTGVSDVVLNGVAWTGVDQTGGATTFPNSTSATGTSTTPSVTITSAVNNATMDCSANGLNSYSAPSKTQTFADFNGNVVAAGSRAAGSASNTHSWTITSSAWVSVGTDILSDGTTPIALIQQTASTAPVFTNAASTRVAYTSAISAGSLLTGILTLGSSVATVSTLSDALGNTWKLAVRQAGAAASSGRAEIWYAENSLGGTNSVLITLTSTAAGTHQVGFHEWANVSTVSALTATNSTTAASSLHGTGGGLTPSSNGLVIVGWRSLTAYSSAVAIAGYSSLSPNLQSRSNAVYRVVGPTSSLENPIWQVGASTIAQGVIAAFSATSTASTGGVTAVAAPWLMAMMGVS